MKVFILSVFLVYSCGRMGERQSYFSAKDPFVKFFQLQSTRREVFRQTTRDITVESFSFQTIIKNRKADILWVIKDSNGKDNSELSLSQSIRSNLLNNINSFTSAFTTLGLDFNMAVIGTHYHNRSPLFAGNLTPSNPLFARDFSTSVQNTFSTTKCYHERPFLATTSFFKKNSSWNRSGATLSIVYILAGRGDSTRGTVVSFINEVKSLTSKDPTFYSITTPGMARIAEAVSRTGGTGSNVNDPFDNLLNNVAQDILKTGHSVRLSGTMDTTQSHRIEVTLDGTAVSSNDWSYDDSKKTLSISNIPSNVGALASLQIRYPKKLNSTFRLLRSVDESQLGLMEVQINSRTLSKNEWNYTKSNNSITFTSPPPAGSTITIIYKTPLQKKFLLGDKKLDESKMDSVEVKVNGKLVSMAGWEYDNHANAIVFKEGFIPENGNHIEVVYTDEI